MGIRLLPRSAGSVLVDWIPGIQYTVAVALESYAAGDASAGLAQADAVQLATGLSVLRSICSLPPGVGSWALYDPEGSLVGERFSDTAALADYYKAGITPIVVVGDNELVTQPAGNGVPANWSRSLALACDQAITMIGEARTGPTVSGTQIATPALALPTVAVIVAGVAVTVITTTAVWRFLAPEARLAIATVEKAAEAYTARLDVFRTSGTMPPASEVEKAAVATVEKLGGERSANRWMWGGAAVGGGAALIVGAAWLRRAMA